VRCPSTGCFVLEAGAGCVLSDVGMEFLYTIWMNAFKRVKLNSVKTVCRQCIGHNIFFKVLHNSAVIC
jgi:hypothetical protein